MQDPCCELIPLSRMCALSSHCILKLSGPVSATLSCETNMKNSTFVYSACNDSATFFPGFFSFFQFCMMLFAPLVLVDFQFHAHCGAIERRNGRGNLQRTSGYQPKLVVALLPCIQRSNHNIHQSIHPKSTKVQIFFPDKMRKNWQSKV